MTPVENKIQSYVRNNLYFLYEIWSNTVFMKQDGKKLLSIDFKSPDGAHEFIRQVLLGTPLSFFKSYDVYTEGQLIDAHNRMLKLLNNESFGYYDSDDYRLGKHLIPGSLWTGKFGDIPDYRNSIIFDAMMLNNVYSDRIISLDVCKNDPYYIESNKGVSNGM